MITDPRLLVVLTSIRKSTSDAGRFQFSVENAYRVTNCRPHNSTGKGTREDSRISEHSQHNPNHGGAIADPASPTPAVSDHCMHTSLYYNLVSFGALAGRLLRILHDERFTCCANKSSQAGRKTKTSSRSRARLSSIVGPPFPVFVSPLPCNTKRPTRSPTEAEPGFSSKWRVRGYRNTDRKEISQYVAK